MAEHTTGHTPLHETDVLVVGAGIAGCCTAIEAARAGARVTLICAGSFPGGSSFFGGTWGLGLVGPVDADDETDLVRTIVEVGGGVVDEALAASFVAGIRPGITWLEELGVALRRPQNDEHAREQAYIPCFDHKHRLWRGLERASMERVFTEALDELDVTVLEHCELVELIDRNGAPGAGVCGALLFDRTHERLLTVPSRSVVLAAGGVSGLYEQRLTSDDVLGSVHGIALAHGCRPVNLEFLQMMPGLVAPRHGVVFNEKTFRYAQTSPELPRELLEERSGYGPFTSRLASRAVDLAIEAAGPAGLPLRYAFPAHDVPEFVQVFSAWMERELDISPTDELRITHYAHASNGGIAIDRLASTGVAGLFAAGEVTGGMHGADRIGGLASANALVFGRRAGTSAAAWARRPVASRGSSVAFAARTPAELLADSWRSRHREPCALTETDEATMLAQLRACMSRNAMVVRTADGLAEALRTIDVLGADLAAHRASADASEGDLVRATRMGSRLALARTMLTAMNTRHASLGSHYRIS